MSKQDRQELIAAYKEAQSNYREAYKGVVNYHIGYESNVKVAVTAAGGASGAVISLGLIGYGLEAPILFTLGGLVAGYNIYNKGSKFFNAKLKQIEAKIYNNKTLLDKGFFRYDTQYIYHDLKSKQNALYNSYKEVSDHDSEHPGFMKGYLGSNALIYADRSAEDLAAEVAKEVRNEFVTLSGVDKDSPVFDLIEGL